MQYTLNSDYLWKEIGTQVVILHFKSGVYWTLNETASVIFRELIDQQQSQEEVAEKIVQLYEIDKNQALADIEEFVAQCQQKGVLVVE